MGNAEALAEAQDLARMVALSADPLTAMSFVPHRTRSILPLVAPATGGGSVVRDGAERAVASADRSG